MGGRTHRLSCPRGLARAPRSHPLHPDPPAGRARGRPGLVDALVPGPRHRGARRLGWARRPAGRAHLEIGYEVAPAFRGRRFGVEAARVLVEQAVATGEVDHVIAHALPGPTSTGVLVSLAFEHVADQADPEVGPVWEWRWHRA